MTLVFAWGRYNKGQMKRKIATVPRLVEGSNGDWYVYFMVRNPLTDKMAPLKIYKGFKECTTNAQKSAWGGAL